MEITEINKDAFNINGMPEVSETENVKACNRIAELINKRLKYAMSGDKIKFEIIIEIK